MKHIASAGSLTLALLAAGAGVASAAQLHTTPAQRCELASLVIAGEVTGQEVRWAEGPEGGLETVLWIAVEGVFQGHLPSASPLGSMTFELVLPGGELEDHGLWVEHTPTLADDARYLLLLEPHPTRAWQLVGGQDGAVRLRSDRSPDAPSLTATLREHGGCRG